MSLALYRFLIAAALTVALGIALLFSTAPVQAQDTPSPEAESAEGPDLLTSLDADGRFTTLAAALRQTGLADSLAAAGAVTLFAPTDDAFADLGEGTLEALSTDELTAILLNHVVAGTLTADDLAGAGDLTTLGGAALAAGADDDVVSVGGAAVTEANVTIGDATVHVVDAVLSPSPTMSDDAAPDDGGSM